MIKWTPISDASRLRAGLHGKYPCLPLLPCHPTMPRQVPPSLSNHARTSYQYEVRTIADLLLLELRGVLNFKDIAIRQECSYIPVVMVVVTSAIGCPQCRRALLTTPHISY